MTSIDLILFDCDGVLVDSEVIAAEVEADLLTESGYPISPEEMGERFAGMTWHNTLLAIEKESDIPLSASLLNRHDAVLDTRLAREVKMIEGVEPMLVEAAGRAVRTVMEAARITERRAEVGAGHLERLRNGLAAGLDTLVVPELYTRASGRRVVTLVAEALSDQIANGRRSNG